MTAEGPLLEQVCRLADDLRRETVGDEVTYVVNRNINFTNVCYVGCRFCAFAQRRTDADAYSLSLDEVADRAQEAWELGATEVCMQGGIDPELPATAYFDLVTAVKQRVPEMHVHAFSPMEVVNGTARTGLSIEDFLIKAREAGLGSLPGTAAEILDDEVRWVLTKGKLPTRTWIEVVSTAHRVGIPTTSTMMYGHVDNPRHWVNHLRVLCRIQDETGQGFTEFVPLPFVHTSAPIYLAGVARPGPTLRDNLAVHALARILLHGRIRNIQTSWVKLGVDGTRAMLAGRRQRRRRHPDGGDHLPDGRLRARLGQDRRGARRDRRRHRPPGRRAHHDLRPADPSLPRHGGHVTSRGSPGGPTARDGVDAGSDQQDHAGDDRLPLRAQARAEQQAVGDDRDHQCAEDGVARAAAAAEQRRATDDRGGHREEQHVAGAEVQGRRRLRRGEHDAAEGAERRAEREGGDLHVHDVDAGAAGGLGVAAGGVEVPAPRGLGERDGAADHERDARSPPGPGCPA